MGDVGVLWVDHLGFLDVSSSEARDDKAPKLKAVSE